VWFVAPAKEIPEEFENWLKVEFQVVMLGRELAISLHAIPRQLLSFEDSPSTEEEELAVYVAGTEVELRSGGNDGRRLEVAYFLFAAVSLFVLLATRVGWPVDR
jgi:hypothetical protein